MSTLSRYATCTDPDDPVGTHVAEHDTYEEAREHARRGRLAVVEHVYEWQEAIIVDGDDYTPDTEQRDPDTLDGAA